MAASHTRVLNPLSPVWDGRSRVLVLGAFPSVKSRECGFYYGNPQNRFWRVLAAVFGESDPAGTQEKRLLALRHGVALWDVLAECDIIGSSDQSIRNAAVNDVAGLLRRTGIRTVYCNGKRPGHSLPALPGADLRLVRNPVLPSTSPANAAWTFTRLVEAWRVIAE